VPDDNSNRPGERPLLHVTAVVTEGVEKSKPAAGRTLNQRMTAVGVAALVLTLLNWFPGWLLRPAKLFTPSPPNKSSDRWTSGLSRGDKPTSGEVDRSLGKCGNFFRRDRGGTGHQLRQVTIPISRIYPAMVASRTNFALPSFYHRRGKRRRSVMPRAPVSAVVSSSSARNLSMMLWMTI